MEQITAFIDESGTNVINTQNESVSNFFICVAAIIKDEDIDNATLTLKEIQNKFTSGGEIKSSKVGRKHSRRLQILLDLLQIPFYFYAIIIDKAKIFRDSGLSYKPVFYKNINSMLYERLARSSTSLNIIADTIGGENFMNSFEDYLAKKLGPSDLFDQSQLLNWTHSFQTPQEAPLLQVADFIAGTLSYCYDPEKNPGEIKNQFLDNLLKKEIGLRHWPPRYVDISDLPTQNEQLDYHIRTICRNSIVRFLSIYEGSKDEKTQMQVSVLRHLLLIEENEPTYNKSRLAEELISYLEEQGFESMSKRKFQNAIIGALRDKGVIIRGDNKGYRLAMTKLDIYKYINHDRRIIEPMLERLSIARDLLRTGTHNSYDMLNENQFSIIHNLVNTFKSTC